MDKKERIREVKPKFRISAKGVLIVSCYHKDLANKGRTTGRYQKSTGFRLDTFMWDTVKNRLADRAGRKDEYNEIKNQFKLWTNRIEKVFEYHQVNKLTITKQSIDEGIERLQKNQVLSKDNKLTLLQFIKAWLDDTDKHIYLRKNVRKPYSKSAINNKEQSYRALKEFSELGEFDFNTLDKKTYDRLVSFLLKTKEWGDNHAGKIIKELKFFLSLSLEEGYDVPRKVFKIFKSFGADSSINTDIAISINDILKVYNLQFNGKEPTLKGHSKDVLSVDKEIYRDWFVLGCFLGMRVSDLLSLNKNDISVKEDGAKWIEKKTSKTGSEVFVKVSPIVEAILSKYQGFPPPIVEQKLNKHIKTIFQFAGFDYWEKVKTHTMRRSFCTNAYESCKGIGVEKIMAVSGHTTLSSFLLYVKVSPERHAHMTQEIAFFEEVSPLSISMHKVG